MAADNRAVCPFTSDTVLDDAECGCESTGDCKEPEGRVCEHDYHQVGETSTVLGLDVILVRCSKCGDTQRLISEEGLNRFFRFLYRGAD